MHQYFLILVFLVLGSLQNNEQVGGVVPEVLSAQSNLVSGSSAEGDPVLVNERINPPDVHEVSISNEQKIDQLLGELLDSSKEPKLKKIYEELRPDERDSLFSRFFDGIKNMYFQTLNNYWSSIEFFIMNGHVFDDAKIQTAIAIDMIMFEEEEQAMGKFFEAHNKVDYSTLFLTVFFANRWHKLDFLFNKKIVNYLQENNPYDFFQSPFNRMNIETLLDREQEIHLIPLIPWILKSKESAKIVVEDLKIVFSKRYYNLGLFMLDYLELPSSEESFDRMLGALLLLLNKQREPCIGRILDYIWQSTNPVFQEFMHYILNLTDNRLKWYKYGDYKQRTCSSLDDDAPITLISNRVKNIDVSHDIKTGISEELNELNTDSSNPAYKTVYERKFAIYESTVDLLKMHNRDLVNEIYQLRRELDDLSQDLTHIDCVKK